MAIWSTFSVVGLKTGSATLYLMKGDCVDAASTATVCIDETGAEVEDYTPITDAAGDAVAQDDDFRIGGGLQEGR